MLRMFFVFSLHANIVFLVDMLWTEGHQLTTEYQPRDEFKITT